MKEFFPLKKPYPKQAKILEAIEEALKRPEKFILLRAPTGLGKSAIAMTAAIREKSLGEKTHILVSRKYLQDQYVSEFKRLGVRSIRGKSNYPCPRAEMLGGGDTSCDNCLASTSPSPKRYISKHCSLTHYGSECPYLEARKNAGESSVTVSNFESCLFHVNYTQALEKRSLMVVDEAHGLESRLANFNEVIIPITDISDKAAMEELDGKQSGEDYLSWLTSALSRCLNEDVSGWAHVAGLTVGEDNSKIEAIADLVEKLDLSTSKKASPETRLGRSVLLQRKVAKLIEYMTPNPKNWVVERQRSEILKKERLVFTPVLLGGMAHRTLFDYADKVILMSATLDSGPFLTSLGIRHEDVASFIDVGSSFKLGNRPLLADFRGSMSFTHKNSTLPRIADRVTEILRGLHPNDKGCIHTHSFSNSEQLKKLLPKDVRDRILWHGRGEDLEKMIKEFFASDNLWLASPSCSEGLDGKDDLIRAQVILKTPYPNLSDKRVAARMDLPDGRAWYASCAASSLIQAYGRGVRGPEDFCVTYVMDSGAARLIMQTRSLLPKWFVDTWAKSSMSLWEVNGGRWSIKGQSES